MSGKVSFGVDYLYIMRDLIMIGNDQAYNNVCDSVARLFLLDWDLSIEEIDEVNSKFWEKVNNKELEDLSVVVNRVLAHVNKEKAFQERFTIEMAALGALDGNVNNDEQGFVYSFKDMFDMKQSEFLALLQKGVQRAIALNFVGEQYRALEESKSM